MDSVTIKVKGSGKEPYTLRLEHEGATLRAYCDCQAGSHGMWCKHRRWIFDGKDSKVVEGAEHVPTVAQWYQEINLRVIMEAAEEIKRSAAAAESSFDARSEELREAIESALAVGSIDESALERFKDPLFGAAVEMHKAAALYREARDRAIAEMYRGSDSDDRNR